LTEFFVLYRLHSLNYDLTFTIQGGTAQVLLGIAARGLGLC
jgi:hypothetical protein